MPPPKPSIKKYDYSTGSYRSLGVSSMATFNNASAGCWTGDSIILLPEGKSKRADEIKPGDRVATLSDHMMQVNLPYHVKTRRTIDNVLKLLNYHGKTNGIHLIKIMLSFPLVSNTYQNTM